MFFHWRRGLIFWALLFIVVGVLIWLGNLGILNFRWGRDWPVLLLVFGVYFLVKAIPRRRIVKRKATRNLHEVLSRLQRVEITAEQAAEEMEE